jgi:maltose alpha-D-glucosyltransferase/alpha-amylase
MRNCIAGMACLLFILAGCKQNAQKEQPDNSTVSNVWYKNSIIYNLDVDTYKDSDADGIGDFKGLTSKLGYIKSLGVTTIWLSPFQPTPDKDDGYDVADYYGIDKRLGTDADFTAFIKEAKKQGLKVITDMVLNHTSIEHPWYKAARSDSTSTYRSWYVWSDKKPDDWDEGMVFPGVQTSTWTYDEVAKKYYFHRFYDFQPDLNYENPEVGKESKKILKYWLAKGIDGFRLDAVPFIIDIPKSGSKNPKHMLNLLTDVIADVKKVKPDILVLGESNVAPDENKDYFGENGDRLQMMFNFYANQYLFYALASGETKDFVKALQDTKQKPPLAQWAFFLRNHDEIDLARLSKKQREKVYEKMGPETNMQLYDRGIRRRLAPMLHNPQQLKMAYSLLFSLPGAPVIRSGEEIGMGDDLTLSERLSVRTPMQWADTLNGGFSAAKKIFRPVIDIGDYSYKKINVASEQHDKGSLLNFINRLIHLRAGLPMIGLANWEVIKSSSDKVVIIKYNQNEKTLITVHNFSDKPVKAVINAQNDNALKSLLNGKNISVNDGRTELNLPGYGFDWLSN